MSVGYLAGFVGEGEIGYAGTNAIAPRAARRARSSASGSADAFPSCGSTSSAARRCTAARSTATSGRTRSACAWPPARQRARRRRIVGDEVEALYTNGPAGGGGTRKYVTEQIGIVSTLLDRARVTRDVTLREWNAHAEVV